MRRHADAGPRRREGRDLHLRAVRRVGARAENFSLGAYAVAATAIGRQRRSNWYHPLAFGTEPDDDEDDLATHYLNGAQIDEDAYDDGFVVSRVAWLDASGQSQDEDEEGGDDEEEDAGEGGDEDADADEDRRLQAVAGYSVTLTVTDEAADEDADADEDRRLQAGGDLFYMCDAVWKSTSAPGAFSAMARPSWLGRAVRNRHGTPSSRRCVDGVEEEAMIQNERAVKF